MAIKRLSAEETATGYRFVVLLDQEKYIPDPSLVRVYEFGKLDGKNRPLSPSKCWEEARLLAEEEAGRVAPGKALNL